jgi:hypothetical protein
MRRALAALATAAGLVVVAGAPAQAIAPFGPISTVVNPACDFEMAYGDAAVSSTGTVRGFVSFSGGGCGTTRTIRYFQGKGSTWSSAVTPHRGIVLSTTHDSTGVYLLFGASDGVRLAKRSFGGSWLFNKRLSPKGIDTGAVYPQGDVVASAGKWWAVWTEQVGPGGEFAQQDLFQSSTFASPALSRRRITSSNDDDVEPTLTLRPSGAGGFLAWTRNDGAAGLRSAVRVARAPMSGGWSAKQLSADASSPDLTTRGSTIYLAYERAARVTVDYDPWTTPTTANLSAVGTGYRPRVSVSGGHAFVGWNTTTAPNHVVVADRVSGAVTQSNVTAGVATDQQLVRVLSTGGKATVLVVSYGSHRLWARSQA